MSDEHKLDEFMPDECTDEEAIDDEETSEELPFISLPNPSVEALIANHARPPRADFLPAVDDPEVLRVLAVGSRTVVNIFVHRLHQAGIAHFSEWSRLLPTPNPGEFMRLLTKRIPIERVE
ncbi:MAG: hypothetical protein HC895_14700 [Leptolyngbyaceae cyanobacterium SM1_3_5]|nr:hypothetical protein [Leptolyngbyaceae cyanobacterium SM1_3_5]